MDMSCTCYIGLHESVDIQDVKKEIVMLRRCACRVWAMTCVVGLVVLTGTVAAYAADQTEGREVLNYQGVVYEERSQGGLRGVDLTQHGADLFQAGVDDAPLISGSGVGGLSGSSLSDTPSAARQLDCARIVRYLGPEMDRSMQGWGGGMPQRVIRGEKHNPFAARNPVPYGDPVPYEGGQGSFSRSMSLTFGDRPEAHYAFRQDLSAAQIIALQRDGFLNPEDNTLHSCGIAIAPHVGRVD